MGRKAIDLVGQRAGLLTVIEQAGYSKNRETLWRCKCECGSQVLITGSHFRAGDTISCGCVKRNRIANLNLSHGGTRSEDGKQSRLYGIWNGMKKRCYNPNSKNYKDYGGRGITVCPEWFHDLELSEIGRYRMAIRIILALIALTTTGITVQKIVDGQQQKNSEITAVIARSDRRCNLITSP